MSDAALAWAMATASVDDPLDRLILIYLGDSAGGGNNDYESGYSESNSVLRAWTGLSTEDIVTRLEALAERGVLRILDPDSLHSLAPSCEVDLNGDA